MALDFSDATVLGYNVQFEFLGDQSYNHRKVISLQIQGYLTEGLRQVVGYDDDNKSIRRNNLVGVRENFRKINEQIDNAGDYWDDDLIINGTNWGRGRITSLSFDSSPGTTTDMIRVGSYTADVEVYKEGDLQLFNRLFPPDRQDQLQGEIGERLHLRRVEIARSTDQAREGHDEIIEGKLGIRGIDAEDTVRAIASPMHGPAIDQAPEGLGRHGALHGMELIGIRSPIERHDIQARCTEEGKEVGEIDRHGVALDRVIRVAQIPGQVIHIAEDMATRARL